MIRLRRTQTGASIALLVLAACTGAAGGDRPGEASSFVEDQLDPFVAISQATERSGEQVYAEICGYCHDHTIGPGILGRGLPPESLEMITRNGLNAMPAFRKTDISDRELAVLAEWIAQSAPAGDTP